jgi:hypothetical protein
MCVRGWAPSGVRASFLGILPADPLDPRESLSVASFAVSVASPPGATLLGWNVFFALDGAPLSLQTTLPTDLPASTPLRLPPWDPAHHSARIALAAINYAAQGPLSSALTLVVPASVHRRIRKLLRSGTPGTAKQGTQRSKGK